MKEGSDEIDFQHADKHESFQQIDAMIFDGDDQAFPKFPKYLVCSILQYLEKEVNILHVDKYQFQYFGHQRFLQGDLSLQKGMIKHSQSNQSNKFAIFLQYLKKEVRDGGYFLHTDKRQSFHKLALAFLMEVGRHVQSTQNRKFVIFL